LHFNEKLSKMKQKAQMHCSVPNYVLLKDGGYSS
jgi:hypothetical protein